MTCINCFRWMNKIMNQIICIVTIRSGSSEIQSGAIKILLSTISVKCFNSPNRLNQMISIKFLDWPSKRLIWILTILLSMISVECFDSPNTLNQMISIKFFDRYRKSLFQTTIQLLIHFQTQDLNQVLFQILIQLRTLNPGIPILLGLIQVTIQVLLQTTIQVLIHLPTQVLNQVFIQVLTQMRTLNPSVPILVGFLLIM